MDERPFNYTMSPIIPTLGALCTTVYVIAPMPSLSYACVFFSWLSLVVWILTLSYFQKSDVLYRKRTSNLVYETRLRNLSF